MSQNIQSNHYGDQVDSWKTDLILARAVKHLFSRRELSDVQQEVVPVVAAFNYDHITYPHASEVTVLTSVIDHQLMKIIRSRTRYQAMKEEVARREAVAEAARPELNEAADITAWDRGQDVATCLARLDTGDRAICAALADGESIDGIAKRLKLRRRYLENAIRRIRAVFTVMGMDTRVGAV